MAITRLRLLTFLSLPLLSAPRLRLPIAPLTSVDAEREQSALIYSQSTLYKAQPMESLPVPIGGHVQQRGVKVRRAHNE
jgi:hypothetical protein